MEGRHRVVMWLEGNRVGGGYRGGVYMRGLSEKKAISQLEPRCGDQVGEGTTVRY